MNPDIRFIDTNVFVYLLSSDSAKADRAELVIAQGGVISVQVLNEFASVAVREGKMSVAEIREVEDAFCSICKIVPITKDTHLRGLELREKYGFSVHDAMIAASALLAGCQELISEAMQHGQMIEDRVTIRNPFN